MESSGPILVATTLHKVFRMGSSEVHALDGVSLSIEPGEFVAIMGPSGSGKTTLMNILGCLDHPTSGSYRLLGEEVSRLGAADLARIRGSTLGFVFQSFNLLPRTSAVENVELPLLYSGSGGHDVRERAIASLERVGLGDRIWHKSNELSGGQQQRVAIARAIVNEPIMVLADEPTGNLDSTTSIEIMALFQELNRSGVTLLLVTHEPDLAVFTSRVIHMLDGRIDRDMRQTPDDAAAALASRRRLAS
jgi:putative ABC transport system ATP-binding protein